jgi:hypothetical protein
MWPRPLPSRSFAAVVTPPPPRWANFDTGTIVSQTTDRKGIWESQNHMHLERRRHGLGDTSGHVCQMVFTQQRIRNFVGNRLVEEHIRDKAQATETELVQIGVPFAVLS